MYYIKSKSFRTLTNFFFLIWCIFTFQNLTVCQIGRYASAILTGSSADDAWPANVSGSLLVIHMLLFQIITWVKNISLSRKVSWSIRWISFLLWLDVNIPSASSLHSFFNKVRELLSANSHARFQLRTFRRHHAVNQNTRRASESRDADANACECASVPQGHAILRRGDAGNRDLIAFLGYLIFRGWDGIN